MPKLRTLNGRDIVAFYGNFGFILKSQKGSHIKLHRFIDGTEQILVIPDRKPLGKGLLKTCYNQALVFISKDDLDLFYYTNNS